MAQMRQEKHFLIQSLGHFYFLSLGSSREDSKTLKQVHFMSK